MSTQKIHAPDRYGFCVISGKVLVMNPEDRSKDTMDWMANTLFLNRDAIATMVRGYFLRDRIQFFTGYYYTCHDVTEDIIMDAVACHASIYGLPLPTSLATPIYNGVCSGNVGDTWPPILKWDIDIGRWEVIK